MYIYAKGFHIIALKYCVTTTHIQEKSFFCHDVEKGIHLKSVLLSVKGHQLLYKDDGQQREGNARFSS